MQHREGGNALFIGTYSERLDEQRMWERLWSGRDEADAGRRRDEGGTAKDRVETMTEPEEDIICEEREIHTVNGRRWKWEGKRENEVDDNHAADGENGGDNGKIWCNNGKI